MRRGCIRAFLVRESLTISCSPSLLQWRKGLYRPIRRAHSAATPRTYAVVLGHWMDFLFYPVLLPDALHSRANRAGSLSPFWTLARWRRVSELTLLLSLLFSALWRLLLCSWDFARGCCSTRNSALTTIWSYQAWYSILSHTKNDKGADPPVLDICCRLWCQQYRWYVKNWPTRPSLVPAALLTKSSSKKPLSWVILEAMSLWMQMEYQRLGPI